MDKTGGLGGRGGGGRRVAVCTESLGGGLCSLLALAKELLVNAFW